MRLVVIGCVLVLVGCAKKMEALPGDSVAADGGVTLSPPRLQTAPVEPPREPLGPIERRLFPPELVMEHQTELEVTPAQKALLLAETDRGQKEMTHLQWELAGEKEKLVKLLDGDHADEAVVAKAAAKVMEAETKVKAAHLAMLVRVKNALTPAQIGRLRVLREGT